MNHYYDNIISKCFLIKLSIQISIILNHKIKPVVYHTTGFDWSLKGRYTLTAHGFITMILKSLSALHDRFWITVERIHATEALRHRARELLPKCFGHARRVIKSYGH